MNFGTYARIEAVSGVYVLQLSAFLDNYAGEDSAVVDAERPCDRLCNVDMSDGNQRFAAFCRAMGYPESELRLILQPADKYPGTP